MSTGPGIYNFLCTEVRERTQAAGVILIVVDGNRGSGFSVQVIAPELNLKLPAMLRLMADQIEAQQQAEQQPRG
jgi:hypothetical protein